MDRWQHPRPADSYALDRSAEFSSEIDRLPRQAATSFPFELSKLRQHGLSEARALLDLGSGEGAYLSNLARAFPELKVAGIEANEALIGVCQDRFPELDIRLGDASGGDEIRRAVAEFAPEIITARYVLQHLDEGSRKALIANVRREKGAARFVCIEADDELFQVFPTCPAITEMNRLCIERQERLGGDRRIGKRLAALLDRHGYADIRATPVLVSSQEVGLLTWWETYGPAFRRGFDDFASSKANPVFVEADRWIADHAKDRTAWLSKIVHIVSGI